MTGRDQMGQQLDCGQNEDQAGKRGSPSPIHAPGATPPAPRPHVRPSNPPGH
jgi:hypothetical protein